MTHSTKSSSDSALGDDEEFGKINLLIHGFVIPRYLDMMTKAFTMRLPEDKAAELEAVARADGVPVSEAVRDAIDHHIDARRKDKDFQARLSQLMENDKRVLDRLAQ